MAYPVQKTGILKFTNPKKIQIQRAPTLQHIFLMNLGWL